MLGQSINCKISTVSLRDDEILQIEVKQDEHFEIEDMHELIEAAEKIGSGKKFLNLIIVKNFTLPSNEAMEYSSSVEGCRYKLADAFVIDSLAQKIIGNFIMNFLKPPVPTNIFNSKEEAVYWLNSLEF